MKTKLFFALAAFSFAITANAQKPFKELGLDNEVEVLTLSNGRYVEYFTYDTLRQIGSVMFNTVTHKVEYFIPQDDTARQQIIARAKEASRWLSIDPLAGKYPFASPYNFTLNNPINNVDNDGRDVKPLTGGDATKLASAFSNYSTLFYTTTYAHGVDVGDAKGKFASQNVFTTSTSAATFEKRLAKSDLSDAEKSDARAVFQVLSSKDIVEIGVVTPASNATSDKTASTTTNEYVGSTNANVKTLLNDPNKTSETIDKSFSGEIVNGTNPGAGAYGFYPQPSNNQTATPQGGDGKFVGTLLVTPGETSTPSFGGTTAPPDPAKQETKAIIKSIKSAQDQKVVTPKQ